MTTKERLEAVVRKMQHEQHISRDALVHGWCNVFSVEAKKAIPDAVIVASDFGGLIDEHEFLKIGNKYYDAQDTSGVDSPDQLKYFRKDFGHFTIPKGYRTQVTIRKWPHL